jgi:multiple sugar transport system permease protein
VGVTRGRWHVGKLLAYAVVILTVLYSIWPIFVMVLEGFDIDLSPLFSGKGVRFVGGVPYYSGGVFPTAIHYLDALNFNDFPRLVEHSLIVALLSVTIALGVGIPVAYALARLNLKGKGLISYLLLALRAVSPFVVIVPLFIIYTRAGIWDTYPGLALAEEVVILSVVVWMLHGFFADIPPQIYDAASIFGCSEGQIFRRVVLRMVVPGIAVTALFAFILIWNEFLIADVLTGAATKTVTVGVWTGLGEDVVNFRVIRFDDLNAAGTLAFIPALAVMLAIRRYLAKGFSLGTAR